MMGNAIMTYGGGLATVLPWRAFGGRRAIAVIHDEINKCQTFHQRTRGVMAVHGNTYFDVMDLLRMAVLWHPVCGSGSW